MARNKIIIHLNKFINTNNLNDREWEEVFSLLHKLAVVYSENSGSPMTIFELYNQISEETGLQGNNLIRAYFDRRINQDLSSDNFDSNIDLGE